MNFRNMMEQVARLHLKRPLVFFDLETTGTKVGVDRIVSGSGGVEAESNIITLVQREREREREGN